MRMIMELVTGVNIHFIKSGKFKTNQIKVRFSAPLSEKTMAGRVLASRMIETANQLYPTSQQFREQLANLYGANFSTSVSKRGQMHYIDIHLSYVRDAFLSKKNVLTDQMLELLKVSLNAPLAENDRFDSETFSVEKKNLITELEAEIENHFYYAHQQLNHLFYDQADMKLSKYASVEHIKDENEATAYQALQEMLKSDRIDFFFMGDFNELAVIEKIEKLHLQPRQLDVNLFYQQPFSNVVREGLEQRDIHQSILELGYHFPVRYGEREHFALIVLNGLLGAFSHSKLFTTIREKEGLAYTISSHFDIFSNFLRIYAGIDRKNRTRTMTLMSRQINDLKRGKFTTEEINLTKEMIINAAKLSQDRPGTLLERAYLQTVLGKQFLSIEDWIQAIEEVTKEEMTTVAKSLKLQSVYFMEGRE